MKHFLRLTIAVMSLAAVTFVPGQTPSPPSPTPTPSVTPSPVEKQTLASLQSRIRRRMQSPEAFRSRVGVKIVSLSSGKVVFENDSEKYYMPASNMKNFTVAAALELLGPDFRFVTGVHAPSAPDSSGTVRGDLTIKGRGDVSFSTLFATLPVTDPDIYYEAMDRLADKILAAGVRRVEGSIVADETYFVGNGIPLTWEWDDLQWEYGAEISAFPINNNAVDLIIKGGTAGSPCLVTILPSNTLFRVSSTCTTAGTKRDVAVKKSLEKNELVISGTIPAGDTFTTYITVNRPADLFAAILKQRLEKKGIAVTGGARVSTGVQTAPLTEITRLESPPLSLIAAKTMKPSQNMFTEVILWTMGEELGRKKGGTGESSKLGINALKTFLLTAGIPADSIVPYDGSGLSRHNLVTPSAVIRLYDYMAKSRNAQVWRDSLAVGGVDGTLKRRFSGTTVAGNFRGKTGTLDQVSALSGYVRTAAGEELIVSIIVNGLPEPSKRTSLIDDIVLQLANFDGKID